MQVSEFFILFLALPFFRAFDERKEAAQEKRISQHRLQRASETPLMEDEMKPASLR